MGTQCDMVQYDSGAQSCVLYPNTQLKAQNVWDVVEKASSATITILTLQCSPAQENLLVNNDFATESLLSKSAEETSGIRTACIKLSFLRMGRLRDRHVGHRRDNKQALEEGLGIWQISLERR